MSQLSNFLFGKNPADVAMPYYQQIPGVVEGEMNPYKQAGLDAMGKLGPQFDNIMNDPSGFINALMGKYQESPGLAARKKEAMGIASNTAAAGGFTGTEGDMERRMGIADRLSSEDMNNWLQNVLGIYRTGLSGEQGLMGQGYNASRDISDTLANVLGTEGGLAFQGQESRNKQRGDLLKSLGKMGLAALGQGDGLSDFAMGDGMTSDMYGGA